MQQGVKLENLCLLKSRRSDDLKPILEIRILSNKTKSLQPL